MTNLSIVVVSYNSAIYLPECLGSIAATAGEMRPEVFVVDNKSTDGSASLVEDEFPWCRLIRNQENRGFAAANNQAIVQCRGRYIMLLNSDTVMLPNTLEGIVAFMEDHPRVGVVGCKLLNPDGSLQPSITTFPNPLRDAIAIGLKETVLKNDPRTRAWLAPIARFFGLRLSRFDDHAVTKEIDYPRGACLIVRREVVDQVGLLDESYFFGIEEMDWCYRMKRGGWQVYYYPEASVIHHGHGATKQMMGKVFVQMRKGALQFYEKHYGRGKTEAMKFLVSAVLTLKLLGISFRLLFAPSDSQRLLAQRESYWTVVRMYYDRKFRALNVFFEMPFRHN